MKPIILLTALVAAATVSACARSDSGVDPQRLSDHIKVLASDEFEGRGPGTPGETKTVAYIVGQMQAIGLEPGGAMQDGKRGWTQDVPLARSEIVGPLKLSLTAGGKTDALTQGEQVTIKPNATGLTKVDIASAPLVFVGYGVKAPERNWDDFKGADLHGKIAVVLVNDPDFETGQGDFGGKAMTYYGRWTYKYEEMARQGALGVLVVHETAPASYGWATVKNSNGGSMLDIVRANPSESHPVMEGWIQRDVAVDLFKRSGQDFEALKKLAQTRDFKPVTLAGASWSASYAVQQSRIVTKNIAGILPGTTKPNETVIYSGHWDHLGIGEPDATGDKIYNGAADNADGVASILEIARRFKAAPRTKRSVVFMTVTAEEEGLLGSEYYGANPLYPLATTVGVLNLDMFATTGPAKDVSISGAAPLSLVDDLIAAAKTQGRTFTPDNNPGAGSYYRSDHFPFAKRGVPALSIESGRDLVDGGKAAGDKADQEFNEKHYHQPSDQWSPSMNLTGVAQNANLAYVLGRSLANSSKWPTWGAGAEFKALRDETAAARK
jgi:Zn-dependent M28 family amino/carboxypeptidase